MAPAKKREHPKLIVDWHASGQDHFVLRVYCIRKQGRQVIRESLDTIYRPEGWKAYLERHPEPWCRPEESYTGSLRVFPQNSS